MTTLIAKPKLLTADDLLRLHSQGVRGELVRGVLHKTAPGGLERGELTATVGYLLSVFVKPRRLGRVMMGVGVILERDPDTVRRASVSFVSAQRRPLGVRNTGYAEIPPELVVEIRSPGDSAAELDEKARMWIGYGVLIVWAVHPDARTVDVYRADGTATALTEWDMLDGGEALPGFSCAVSVIFDI